MWPPVVPEVVSFSADDEPEVEVLWEGAWCFGLLAEWKQVDGRWIGWVRFSVKPGETRNASFDQDLIRPFTGQFP